MKLYIGIDPGAVSGAWGIVDHNGKYWSCGNIPHDHGRIKAKEFRAELSQAIDQQDAVIVIESVHSMPNQGVASTFKFGRAVGAIEAICESFFGTWFVVTPQRWKKDTGVTQDKDSALQLARQKFPNAPLGLRKDHNKAEALLLAEWLRGQDL